MKLDWRIAALASAILISTLLAYQCDEQKKKVTETQKSVKSLSEEAESLRNANSSLAAQSESTIKQLTEEYEAKVKSLTKERDTLKKRTYKERLKVVKPDGSVVEKEIERSDEESTREVLQEVQNEYSKKIIELEQKYKSEYAYKTEEMSKEYSKKLQAYEDEKTRVEEEYKKSTKTTKRLRTEGGMELDKDYYGHLSYSLSPFIIGGGVSVDDRRVNDARLGIGLEW